jgi:phosphomannomutase
MEAVRGITKILGDRLEKRGSQASAIWIGVASRRTASNFQNHLDQILNEGGTDVPLIGAPLAPRQSEVKP